MTRNDIQLVKQSWSQLAPGALDMVDQFYGKVFELDPELRELFPADMKEQSSKLLDMLHVLINGLDYWDSISTSIKQLGGRHLDYGVQDRHYDIISQAWMWTLLHNLGEDFTADMQHAWCSTFNLLMETMKEGAARKAD